jgi:hypothetical protein
MRLRQHTNPLQKHLLEPPLLPQWCNVFADATNELHVDVGCGVSSFLLHLAQVLDAVVESHCSAVCLYVCVFVCLCF